MVVVGVVALWAVIGLICVGGYQIYARRQRTLDRFVEATQQEGEYEEGAASRSAESTRRSPPSTRRLARRWIWVPWTIGAITALVVWIGFGWPLQYVLAIGAVVALLLSQVESFLHTRHIAKLERQLADAIDIMVGAVSAGAALGPAMEAATHETDRPLKRYLQEISGRIRLGDDPASVFRSLADRVPLETFLLFSSSLAVHFEVGGRLAPTLAIVGRTIRDRIEITRRIQSNIAQSQFSTFAILGLVYLIAVIVWRNGPEPMREFVTSTVGSWFIAGSVILQAVGIAWMGIISKPKF
ncbi:type II secretion system F family protein [Allorhodopirellula solitaria]|uniref:Bacterial type II secretion system protein F domain protein n=1 Tax=Allorhodopirellula solitaria TaxID=2527987 RepID=A0A5C5YD87_9BACT|nr:type II secretion system F family protein [Allorhodopirellula solitaria]TWT73330.1 Bacterial type II secretion system protein F domain protein [Allorhodopirellula solitaria]